MKVPAAIATGPGENVDLRTIDIDNPRADEVLVRIVGVGNCRRWTPDSQKQRIKRRLP
jgi:aryl-alcohol dehydrogenase